MSRSWDPKTLVARLGSPAAVRAGRRNASEGRMQSGRSRLLPSWSAAQGAVGKALSSKKKSQKASQRRNSKPKAKSWSLFGRKDSKQSLSAWRVPTPQVAKQIDALSPSARIRFFSSAFILVAVLVAGRAAQLQLIDGERYRLRAIGQGTTQRTISGKRGRILDRHGAELANSVDSESVFAERDKIEDPYRVARLLAPILGAKSENIAKRLEGHGFVYLMRQVSPATARAVRNLKLKGVGLRFEPRRTYGNIKLASHVLGFVDVDGIGRWGIERTMQAELEGRSTQVPSIKDALRRAVWLQGFNAEDPVRGDDVNLTIDRQVQFVAEEVLERTIEAQKARSGVVVVLDSQSAEVLALASFPSFNPNNLSGSTSFDWRNRAVETVFDPGSTSKIVTLAAAIELGKVNLSSRIDCEYGQWSVGGRTIRDANHSFGVLSVAEVFYKSSNIGAGKLGQAIGRDNLYDFLTRFGFGRRTGIELPAESTGILHPPSKWYEVDLVNIAFGQGLSATPIQIIQAANVIANDGVLKKPTIIAGDNHPFVTSDAQNERRVISRRTANTVKEAMVFVTSPDGTAPKAAVPGFRVAGKTGTAQKYDPQLRAYSREKYVASFVGFVPAEDPKVTILVVIDEPKKGIYGGPVAGPAFREIARAALDSKDMYSNEPNAEAWLDNPRMSTVRLDPNADERGDPNRALERVVPELTADIGPSRLSGFVGGESSLIEGVLSKEAMAVLGETLPKKVSQARRHSERGQIMPDLRGLHLGQALDKCAALSLDPQVSGYGRVYRQSPSPGERVGAGARCTLELRRLKRGNR